jgi:hypothetical protein
VFEQGRVLENRWQSGKGDLTARHTKTTKGPRAGRQISGAASGTGGSATRVILVCFVVKALKRRSVRKFAAAGALHLLLR